jgi:hypothetical protein
MREPPLGLDDVPDAALEIFFDEILAARSTEELIIGIYQEAVPSLKASLDRHIQETNPLADQPSVRLCRIALLELSDIARYGAQVIQCLIDPKKIAALEASVTFLRDCLAVAGQLDGTEEPSLKSLARRNSTTAYVYDGVPKRDERFQDPFNMGVHAESFLSNEKYPASAKTIMLYYKRLREIDVPEFMSSIISETKGKPWGYYLDLTRQLWDEARHAMMGEVGFVSMGIDWRKPKYHITTSLYLNTKLTPSERHAVLYFIEQGLMAKTGKRFEWEVAVASDSPLSAVFQDYDWADEVLHARIGRDWYASDHGSNAEAIAQGDRCWSKVLVDWKGWKEQGLTQHHNWWPEVYRDACFHAGVAVIPDVLSFNENYETKRSDLKAIEILE